MANSEHVNILETSIKTWNEWRLNNPFVRPDLRGADLHHLNLFVEPRSIEPDDLSSTKVGPLFGLDFRGTDFEGANLRGTQIDSANLRFANLRNADLSRAFLTNNDFSGADLQLTNFTDGLFRGNLFGNNDLSQTLGLGTVSHYGPSTVGIDTLYISHGKIDVDFLKGCGVPDSFITFTPDLIAAQQPIQFYSCFISYSHNDEEFARHLHARMQSEHLRAWFAPEDIKGGKKLYEQIDQAIQIHDRLLLVLSESSLKSEWVKTEIRKARRVELLENRQKLFPIRLVDFDVLRSWECFDADEGKDLAVEIREYYIPDFSAWKNHSAFELAFDRLLKDLQAAEGSIKLRA